MSSSHPYKPEILVLLSRFPYPLEKGDKLRAYYQLKELAKSFEITLVALTEIEIQKEQFEEVNRFCKKLVVCKLTWRTKLINISRALLSDRPVQTGYFFSSKAKKVIKDIIQSNDYKHIYAQLIRMSEYVKNYHHIPKTLDYMDALSAGILRRVEKQPFYKRSIFKMEGNRLLKYERHIFDFFENRTIISDQDRQLIAHPDRAKIHCVPNGIDKQFFEPIERPETYDFVFVGNMSYPPNVDAVHYIVDSILPELDNATLLISGATPHPSILKLAESNPNISITGWVDDIRTSYANGKIFLAPMMIGTGMQNKLLEAMALKTPCITTSLANNAISAVHEKEIMVGNTKEEIIKIAKLLLHDDKLRSHIAEAGHSLIKDNFSWEKSTSTLIKLIQQA
ncbi:MAG: glycosyltransferase [Crocinitomicaceae bacterium]|nr:glycosyltransferase [Crocinitomicaceae bacterium]